MKRGKPRVNKLVIRAVSLAGSVLRRVIIVKCSKGKIEWSKDWKIAERCCESCERLVEPFIW